MVVKIKFYELYIIGTLDGPGGPLMDYLMWTCRDQRCCYLFLRVLSRIVENNWVSGTLASDDCPMSVNCCSRLELKSGLNARIMVGYK